MNNYHQPVLLHPAIKQMIGTSDDPQTYVDVTFGGGGHSQALLNAMQKDDQLFAFDKDDDALANEWNDDRFTLINADFKHIKKYMKLQKVEHVDAILADIGVSSYQFDTAQRGFSYRFEATLDMSMDQNQAITCATILNTYTEEKLADILEQYGEITNAKQVANDIVKTRRGKALSTISDLKMILQKQGYGKPEKYMACVFQALRIEVNGELDALKQLLIDGTSLLKKGGRMVVISYHSLEDRLVKQYFKNGCFNDEPEKDEFGKITHDIPLKPLGNNAIVPDEEELKLNTRSRSAKMRIGIKK